MEQSLIEFACLLADEAALISRHYFRNPLAIESKANASPVTLADKQIEERLRALIHRHYPTHAIIGEEFSNHESQSDYCWVIDPIDGTAAFASGKPTFTTLIALCYRGCPLFSVIDQAISQERFISSYRHGTLCNGRVLTTSQVTELAAARLSATTPFMFTSPQQWELFTRLRQQVKLVSFGGDAYAYALLAAGHLEIILEADLQYYDVAALVPLIEASGGVISDWQGRPLSPQFNGQCLASANQLLHAQVLDRINNE